MRARKEIADAFEREVGKYGIITPEQAVAHFWDSEAIHFLGLDIQGAQR